MIFEIALGIICLVAWIFGFWSSWRAMIGLSFWAASCVGAAFALARALNAAKVSGADHLFLDFCFYLTLVLCAYSLALGPIIAMVFGLHSKPSWDCVANVARDTYQGLSPEGKRRVSEGVAMAAGVAAAYLADRMERRGNAYLAKAFCIVAQRF